MTWVDDGCSEHPGKACVRARGDVWTEASGRLHPAAGATDRPADDETQRLVGAEDVGTSGISHLGSIRAPAAGACERLRSEADDPIGAVHNGMPSSRAASGRYGQTSKASSTSRSRAPPSPSRRCSAALECLGLVFAARTSGNNQRIIKASGVA